MLNPFKKSKGNNKKKELTLEEAIYLNICDYIISDQAHKEIFEVLSTTVEPFSVYDITTLISNESYTEKYYSKKLELYLIGDILEKSYMKKESDKRAKAYYRLTKTGKFILEGLDFKKQSSIPLDNPPLPRAYDVVSEPYRVNLGYLMRFFPQNKLRANIRDLERLIIKRKVPVMRLELSYNLDLLVISGLVEKIYSKEKGDKRPRLYYQRTSLGKTFVNKFID